MITDPVANMLSMIKNGYRAGKKDVAVPYSQYKENIAKVFMEENFLEEVKVNRNDKVSRAELILKLKYDNKVPSLTDLKQVSKPGLRIYVSSMRIPKVLGGLGVSILSTPQGVMSSKKARKLHVGGEIICNIW